MPLEAILLIKRTGVPLAVWTRADVSEEVISVMAATMVSSIDTILSAFGSPPPENALVETDGHRILVSHIDANAFLVMVAPKTTKTHALRREARRLLARILPEQERSSRPRGSPSAESPPRERPVELFRV